MYVAVSDHRVALGKGAAGELGLAVGIGADGDAAVGRSADLDVFQGDVGAALAHVHNSQSCSRIFEDKTVGVTGVSVAGKMNKAGSPSGERGVLSSGVDHHLALTAILDVHGCIGGAGQATEVQDAVVPAGDADGLSGVVDTSIGPVAGSLKQKLLLIVRQKDSIAAFLLNHAGQGLGRFS